MCQQHKTERLQLAGREVQAVWKRTGQKIRDSLLGETARGPPTRTIRAGTMCKGGLRGPLPGDPPPPTEPSDDDGHSDGSLALEPDDFDHFEPDGAFPPGATEPTSARSSTTRAE